MKIQESLKGCSYSVCSLHWRALVTDVVNVNIEVSQSIVYLPLNVQFSLSSTHSIILHMEGKRSKENTLKSLHILSK